MDKLTPAELATRKLDPKFAQKYKARYERGDVIEIRPDGFYSYVTKASDIPGFALVRLPGVSVQKLHYLCGENIQATPDNQGVIMNKRRLKKIGIDVQAEPVKTVTKETDLQVTDRIAVL